MKSEHQQIFDTTPDDEARSPLEPYRDLILRWKRQGRTYRRILELLRDRCDLTVAYGPLYRFVKRRSRPRKSQMGIELASELPSIASAQTLPAAIPGLRLTPEERAAQVEFIRSLNKPEAVVEKPKPLFDPDLSKPRTKVKQGD